MVDMLAKFHHRCLPICNIKSKIYLHKANVFTFIIPFFNDPTSRGNHLFKRPNGLLKMEQSGGFGGGGRIPNSRGIVPTRLFRPVINNSQKKRQSFMKL